MAGRAARQDCRTARQHASRGIHARFPGHDTRAQDNFALPSGLSMRLQVDHVTVCGSDLAAMRRGFADAGLVTSYGGPHAHGVTHMDQLAFRDGSYLELIAPVARGGAAGLMGGWAKLMEGNAGAGAWAAQSEQIH